MTSYKIHELTVNLLFQHLRVFFFVDRFRQSLEKADEVGNDEALELIFAF